ncbi:bifunctional riboflavin biosynthesis protein RIBA 1, chloroplastic-like protein isoform X2 [Tanacetum coccineum]
MLRLDSRNPICSNMAKSLSFFYKRRHYANQQHLVLMYKQFLPHQLEHSNVYSTVKQMRCLQPEKAEDGLKDKILRDLGVRTMKLMTNNPTKYNGLKGYG